MYEFIIIIIIINKFLSFIDCLSKESNWRIKNSMSQFDQSIVYQTERVDNVEELKLSLNIIHSHSQNQVRMFQSSWNSNYDEH